MRAGITLQLKEAVGCDFIAEREESLMRKVRNWMDTDVRLAKNFVLLGNSKGP